MNPIYKIILLGDPDVGKTSYIVRVCDNHFEDYYSPTIGVDFKTKTMTLENKFQVLVEIWDTAGQERYKSFSQSMVKKADGILLLYDITNRKSFENVVNWIDNIKKNASPKIQIVVIGNKCDMGPRVVEHYSGKRVADQYNLTFFEASCKTIVNVDEPLEHIVNSIFEIRKKNNCIISDREKLKGNNKKREKEKCC